jgi:hypothetical protein
MAALLGLPARSGGAGGGGGMTGDPKSYADRLSAADKLKVDALLKASNSSDDAEYWYGVNAMHGGFDATGADWNKQRISTGDGAGKGYKGPTIQTPGAPVSTAAPAAPAACRCARLTARSNRCPPIRCSTTSDWARRFFREQRNGAIQSGHQRDEG